MGEPAFAGLPVTILHTERKTPWLYVQFLGDAGFQSARSPPERSHDPI
jgi:hypothetical protein